MVEGSTILAGMAPHCNYSVVLSQKSKLPCGWPTFEKRGQEEKEKEVGVMGNSQQLKHAIAVNIVYK